MFVPEEVQVVASMGLAQSPADSVAARVAASLVKGQPETWMLDYIREFTPDRSLGWTADDPTFPSADRITHSLLGGDPGRLWADSLVEVRMTAATTAASKASALSTLERRVFAAELALNAALAALSEKWLEKAAIRITTQVLDDQPIARHQEVKAARRAWKAGERTPVELIASFRPTTNVVPLQVLRLHVEETRRDFASGPIREAEDALIRCVSEFSGISVESLRLDLIGTGATVDPMLAESRLIDELALELISDLGIDERIQASVMDAALRGVRRSVRSRVARVVGPAFGLPPTTDPNPNPIITSRWGKRLLSLAQLQVAGLQWDYGDVETRRRPFDHKEFKDVLFSGPTDEKLLTKPQHAWIGAYYHPNDHEWCQCSWFTRIKLADS